MDNKKPVRIRVIMGGFMRIKIIMFLILGISVTGVCFAQAVDPGNTGESSSTGVWPSVSQEHSDSVGYDSGNHGNVS
jgi:hypothetical protein